MKTTAIKARNFSFIVEYELKPHIQIKSVRVEDDKTNILPLLNTCMINDLTHHIIELEYPTDVEPNT